MRKFDHLQIQKKFPLKSKAHYEIKEYTTEYGALIFDDSKGGEIQNTYLYSLRWKNGIIDFYIDKNSGRFKSIWFVALSGFDISYRENFDFNRNEEYAEPIIDIALMWEQSSDVNQESLWKQITTQIPVEIFHNNMDTIQFEFGKCVNRIVLNEKITMFQDAKGCLSSVLIRDSEEVNKLLKKPLFQ